MGHKKQSKNVQEQKHQGTSTGVQESVKISTVSGKQEVKREIRKIGQISMVSADRSLCVNSLTEKGNSLTIHRLV